MGTVNFGKSNRFVPPVPCSDLGSTPGGTSPPAFTGGQCSFCLTTNFRILETWIYLRKCTNINLSILFKYTKNLEGTLLINNLFLFLNSLNSFKDCPRDMIGGYRVRRRKSTFTRGSMLMISFSSPWNGSIKLLSKQDSNNLINPYS